MAPAQDKGEEVLEVGAVGVLAPPIHEVALGIEALHALPAVVGDEDVAGVVDDDIHGRVELALPDAASADLAQEAARRVVCQDPAVARISDVDVALGIQAQAFGPGEAVNAAEAKMAPAVLEAADQVEVVDAMVLGIRDVDRA
jgi:hypothetical protein